MRKLLCTYLALAIMLSLILCPVTANDNEDAVERITADVTILVDVYEQLHPNSDISFEGSYIEFSIPVILVPQGVVGTYMDFDGDNGYMVIVNGNDVLKWEVRGDLQYLKTQNVAYYSTADGFGYCSDGKFAPFEVLDKEYSDFAVDTPYNGQIYAGEGGITGCDAYIADRYDSNYTVDSFNWLTGNFWYMVQGEFSIYDFVDNGVVVGEGNCGLSSVYALLNYLKTSNKCTNFPSLSEKITYYAGNDSFYSQYASNSNYIINSPIVLPELYWTVRDTAVRKLGYRTGSVNAQSFDELIEWVSECYQEDVNATTHILGGFENCVRSEINASNPVLLAVDNSITYGNHAMVVTGYRVYVKTTTILGINFKDYVYLLRVNDNWSGTARYFDFTAFNSTYSFITVEVE